MIEAGTRIGRYEINSLIGTGGMGEVYRALDTELQRPVAIKFLSADFTHDEKRMQRFIQEARAASALNHPNIITVHEIGRMSDEENAPRFFVTEFIDGITLREQMSVTKMKLDEVLDISIQVSSALIAAHAAGLAHRDIKPENIMVRRDGYVKVLDFGLAKLTERADVDTEAATKKIVNTNPGTVMGTVGYMSPEQALGKDVDARTDIWSLGCVLYEMVTGHQPFEGATASHVIVSILEKEPPPLSLYAQNVPEALEWIVSEALTKDREERCQTAKELQSKLRRLKQRIDAGAELERSVPPTWSGSQDQLSTPVHTSYGAQATAQTRTTARSGEVGAGNITKVSSAEYTLAQAKRHKLATLLALVLCSLVVAGLAFGIYKFINRGQRVASLQPPKITRLTSNGKSSNAAMSPDGKYIAHVLMDAGKQSLLLRQAATTITRELVPPTDGYFLGETFSRDGTFLYYVKGEKGSNVRTLYQVSVLGGESRKLVYDIDSPVSFSPDGKRFAFLRGSLKDNDIAIIIANADGTNEERLAAYKHPLSLDDLAWSPDGKSIAYILGGNDEQGYYVNIDEVRLEDKSERKISADRWRVINSIAWLADGSGIIATARDRASIAGSPMQIWHIAYPNGEARRITNDVNNYMSVSLAADSLSLVAVLGSNTSNIWVMPGVDLSRAKQITSSNQAGDEGLAWTPDGKIVYMSVERENRDLWVMSADGTNQKQLTFEPSADLTCSVSADGRYIIFISNRGAGWGIWRMNVDGSNVVELAKNAEESSDSQCLPGSQWVIYEAGADGHRVLWKVPIEGGAPVQITDKPTFGHAVSPDGKLIAYLYRAPEVNAPLQVEVINFEDGSLVKSLSISPNASYLRWSPNGRALNYVEVNNGAANIWSLPLDGGKPTQLTNGKTDQFLKYAWSSDGQLLAIARGNITNDLVLIEDYLN
ncbi:MAG TPA: protein kinase [Pyrinomonadaceae bacterium]